MKRNDFIEIAFNKEFFAQLLHVHERKLHYVLLAYVDETKITRRPAIFVDGINNWIFDIEIAEFVPRCDQHVLERIQPLRRTKEEVTFVSTLGDKRAIPLTKFYRQYMSKVVNPLS